MRRKIIRVADKLVEYCLYGVIFSIPISRAAIELFASLAILAFIIKKSLQPEFRFIKNYIHLFLLLFIIFNVLSLINSGPFLKKSVEALFFKWLEYILIFLIVEDTLTSHERQRNTLVVLLVVSGLVGIDGLFQRFLGLEFLRHRNVVEAETGVHAITGSFTHYNDFATYLVFVLSVVIALFFSAKIKKIAYRVYLLFLIVLLGFCLLFTFSRGGWLAFIVAVMLMLLLLRKMKFILLAICIYMLVFIMVPVIKERALSIFQVGGDMGRLGLWLSSWKMSTDHFFLGSGLGTFMERLPHYTRCTDIQYAHNCYLQIWAETGIFSLLSFLFFLSLLFLKWKEAFKKNKNFLLLGFICGIFAFLVHSFLDTSLYSLPLAVLFWFMAGFTIAISKLESDGIQG